MYIRCFLHFDLKIDNEGTSVISLLNIFHNLTPYICILYAWEFVLWDIACNLEDCIVLWSRTLLFRVNKFWKTVGRRQLEILYIKQHVCNLLRLKIDNNWQSRNKGSVCAFYLALAIILSAFFLFTVMLIKIFKAMSTSYFVTIPEIWFNERMVKR